MDENRRLAIALAAPVAILAGGAVASIQPSNAPQPQVETAETEVLDPEVEKILYPYRAAKREKLEAEAEKILYPYRTKREEIAKPNEPVNTPEPSSPAPQAVAEVATPKESTPKRSTPVEGDVSDLEALLTSDEGDSSSTADVETPEQVAVATSSADPLPAEPPASEPPTQSAPTTESFALNAVVPPAPKTPEPELTVADPEPALAPTPNTSAVATVVEEVAPVEEVVSADPAVIESVDPEPAAPPITEESDASSSTEIASTVVAQVANTESSEIAEDPAPATPPVSPAPVVSSVPEEVAPSAVIGATPLSPPAATPNSTKDSVVSTKPFLGVGIRDVSGTIVTTIYPNSTARKLGVLLGDQLVALNGVPLTNMQSLRGAIGTLSAGADTTLTINRAGFQYTLGPLPMGVK